MDEAARKVIGAFQVIFKGLHPYATVNYSEKFYHFIFHN